MGPAEILGIFFPLLLFIGLIVYAVKRAQKDHSNLGMAWYSFYTNVRLPLSLVFEIIYLINLKTVTQFLFIFVVMALQITTIIGLSKKKYWGWNVNLFLLFIECIAAPFITGKNPAQIIVKLLIMTFFWFIPNYVYFKKRLNLFS